MTSKAEQAALDLYLGGRSIHDACEETGVYAPNLRRAIREYKINTRIRNLEEALRELYLCVEAVYTNDYGLFKPGFTLERMNSAMDAAKDAIK